MDGVGGIGLLRDDELTFLVGREPYPARAEEGGALLHKFLLEGLERAKRLFDSAEQVARREILALLWRVELGEVEVVVQDLSSVVQHTTFGFEDDFFEWQGFEVCAGNSRVQVVDIRLQMLAVMKGKGFSRDDGLKCVWRVGEGLKCEGHNNGILEIM